MILMSKSTTPSLSIERMSWVLLVSGFAFFFGAAAAHAASSSAKEIIALERSIAAATTPAAIADAYSKDAREYDPAAKVPLIGKAAILAHLTEQMSVLKGVTTEIADISADAEGNLGYAFSEQRSMVTMADGKTQSFHIWATHVLRKEAGKWKIVIEQITYLP